MFQSRLGRIVAGGALADMPVEHFDRLVGIMLTGVFKE